MKQRSLGNTGLNVSEIGLGCWQFGGDFGPIEQGTVDSILNTATENKIDFWDTADVYGAGQSEAYIGAHLKSYTQKPFVATKYGRWDGTYPDGYSLTDMRDAAKRAQDRLQCDAIDHLQLHCVPTAIMQRGEIFDWLREVQQEGHIKFFGASVETIEEAKICAQQGDITSLQIIFNLFRQRMADEVLPMAQEKNIGIIVRLPLASGLLSGKFTNTTQFAATDHRNYNRNGDAFNVGETFAGLPFEKGVELVDELKDLSQALKSELPTGINLAQLSMRWILDHPAVTTIITGASKQQQVIENAAVSGIEPLPEDVHKKIQAFYKDKVESHIRGPY